MGDERFRKPGGQVPMPVLSATVIAHGNMVYYDTGDDTIKPATSLAWNTSEALTQADYSPIHCGIALEASANGETDDVLVDFDENHIFELPLASGTARNIGDLLGINTNGSNAVLMELDTAVAAGANFIVVKAATATDTSVYVKQVSKFMNGAAIT